MISPRRLLRRWYVAYWIRPRASYVVSLPKAGRTWLRFMMASVLSHLTGRAVSLNLTVYRHRRLGVPYILFTHDAIRHPGGRFQYSFDKRAFAHRPVLLLVRDPRDATISAYFHARRVPEQLREELQVGDLAEFIRGPRGIRLAIEFLNSWAANLSVPSRMMVVRYEELQTAPAAMLRAVLEFFGIRNVDEATIAAAVEAGAFENMRQIEVQRLLADERLEPGDVSDAESFKVRRGKVGGYLDYLGPEHVAYLDEEIRRHLSPLYAEYVR